MVGHYFVGDGMSAAGVGMDLEGEILVGEMGAG